MRQKLSIISIFIILFAVISSCTKEKELSTIMNAVPIDASIIFEIPNYTKFANKLKTGSEYWTDISLIPYFSKINKELLKFNTLINTNPDFKTAFLNKNIVISLHASGKTDVDALFILPNNSTINYSKIFDAYGVKDSEIQKITYDEIEIYNFKKDNVKYSLAQISGVILISQSQMLVEKSIRQINANVSILDDKIFNKIALTAGENVDANLFINTKLLPNILLQIIDKNTLNYINNNAPFTSLTELDFSLKRNEIILNGFSSISDSTNNYTNIFAHQTAVKFEMEEVLPATTSMFLLYGISDKIAFNQDYKIYLEASQKLNDYQKNLSLISKKYNYNLEIEFLSFIDDEIALAYTDINKTNLNQNAFAIIKTSGKSMASEKMLTLFNKYSEKEGIEKQSLTTLYSIDEETSFEIYNLPLNIPQTIFGDLFSKINGEYFTFVDNYLVFGNSITSLSEFIHDNVLHKTLENNMQYNQSKENVSADANFNLYINIPAFYNYLNSFFSENFNQNLEANLQLINKFQTLIFQSSIEKEFLYNTIYVKYNPIFTDKPRTVWESKLDTTISSKPYIFINHTNQSKEIFVQDLNNNIYLINSSGRILWKKNVGEQILDEVYQIDMFNNNKFQYLFNTKSKIHLIDRNGNYIDRYPVSLPYKATCGLGLFDYDNNKKYRIAIADQNKELKLYEISGNVLPDWNFGKTDNFVRTKPQHFRIGDKDYIVFSDSLKTYIVDRKGVSRANVSTFFAKSQNNIFYLNEKTETHPDRLITTNTNGEILFVYFDGIVKKFKFKSLSPNHYFQFADINQDSQKDYVFADANQIIAFDKNKEEIFSYSFDGNISERPNIYQFTNANKIGVTIKKLNQIFLLNSDASIHKGFPLKGSTLFSITRFNNIDSEFNLIVGADNEFIFNYKVN